MMVAHLGDYFWGRSPFYQAALHGYGMHTFSHLATVALVRRYTPGVATALPVILPFWIVANGCCGPTGSRCALTDG